MKEHVLNRELGPIGQSIYEIHVNKYPDKLVPRQDAPGITKLALSTLDSYQVRGKGPRSIKIGGKVFYRLLDLARWIDERTEVRG